MTTKVHWIRAGEELLIRDGIGGLKVDRLAKLLSVSRGGFYHRFADRSDFLEQLLLHWEATCRFLPDDQPPQDAHGAGRWLERAMLRLVEGDGYNSSFDLAVRAWARSETRVTWAVERIDRQRITTLQKFFETAGYLHDEAAVRAQIFYCQQIGYATIGVRQNLEERQSAVRRYVEILCSENQVGSISMTRI